MGSGYGRDLKRALTANDCCPAFSSRLADEKPSLFSTIINDSYFRQALVIPKRLRFHKIDPVLGLVGRALRWIEVEHQE